MTTILVIVVIIIIVLSQANKQAAKGKRVKQNTSYVKTSNTQTSKKKIYKEVSPYPTSTENVVEPKHLDSTNHSYSINTNENVDTPRTIQVTPTISYSLNSPNDESIIDVTNQPYVISTNAELKSYSNGVPRWPHQYVYSHTELESASAEQKEFYRIFKTSFLNGEYLDLEGNTNYSFILLFDLLIEYSSHKDISRLEKELKQCGQYYPRTKSYATSFLVEKMLAVGERENALRIQEEGRNSYQSNSYDYDYWKLGSKYKTKLKLTDDEVKLLNRIWYQPNNFNSIEFCNIEILKLYLQTIKELNDSYRQEGTTIDAAFLGVADIVATKQFRYKNGTQNYKYSVESTTNELYLNIYKHCENTVREHYGHKRKINADYNLTQKDAKNEFETKVLNKIRELLPTLVLKIERPNETTDIELYTQNANRWKIRFEVLTSNYNGKPKEFTDAILSLGQLNRKNPSIENIFYEASKFIALQDKESALVLYIHYLYHDMKSTTFDNKQLTKSIQKNLFKTQEQLEIFERIINEFISYQDLEKAINSVPSVYEVKRKKIKLDTTSIKEVQKQHSGTVELLNEYLKDDEDEIGNNKIKWQEKNSEEIEIEITHKSNESNHLTYTSDIAFTPIHTTALDLFAKSNFTVPQSEFETFAKSKGLFKNQLIESINEVCYDYLDDVLIEEEDEHYIINTNYYQRIFAK